MQHKWLPTINSINDLVLHCKYSEAHKYADDTSLCASGINVA